MDVQGAELPRAGRLEVPRYGGVGQAEGERGEEDNFRWVLRGAGRSQG